MIRSKSATWTAAAVLLGSLGLSGCGDDPTSPSAQQQRDLDTLRGATSAFADFSRAQAAGYNTQLTDCMSDATGGMGFHYGKAAIIDGAVSVAEPEVLLYEPQRDGSLQLVGIEYIMPLTASATPPTLFGQTFKRNEAFQLWALHVWLYRNNPSGLYSDWNPTVSCAAAK
jgi:hypothetical protein